MLVLEKIIKIDNPIATMIRKKITQIVTIRLKEGIFP